MNGYIPLPDEPAEERKRFTTVHDRYQVAHMEYGLLETAMRKADAIEMAQYHADRLQTSVVLYDSMGRHTQRNEWTFDPKGNAR